MDWTAQYCPIRRDIEEHCWNLASRLSETTAILVKSIGRDRGLFLTTRSACEHTREELADSQHELAKHRIAHGC
jgi:hypothetical protein